MSWVAKYSPILAALVIAQGVLLLSLTFDTKQSTEPLTVKPYVEVKSPSQERVLHADEALKQADKNIKQANLLIEDYYSNEQALLKERAELIATIKRQQEINQLWVEAEKQWQSKIKELQTNVKDIALMYINSTGNTSYTMPAYTYTPPQALSITQSIQPELNKITTNPDLPKRLAERRAASLTGGQTTTNREVCNSEFDSVTSSLILKNCKSW